MRRLHLMRHGPAVDRAPSGRDADRPLSAEGREVVLRAAGGLAARLADEARAIDAVVSSPYARARETAELVAAELRVASRTASAEMAIAFDVSLVPSEEPPIDLALRLLSPMAGQALRDILVVGHLPTLELLARGIVQPGPSSTALTAALHAGMRTAMVLTFEAQGSDPYPRFVGALDR